MSMDLKTLTSKWNDRYQTSTCPADIRKLSLNYIQDEEKSVKWNREYVASHNAIYTQKAAELQRQKRAKIAEVENEIISFIRERTELAREKAEVIFTFVKSQYIAEEYEELDCMKDDIYVYDDFHAATRSIEKLCDLINAIIGKCHNCAQWKNGDCYRLELSRPTDYCSYFKPEEK